MWIKLLPVLMMLLVSASNLAYGMETEPDFPIEVAKFIEDRKSCDHFRSEPRDFDESYKREFGQKAELEEAERAAYLEKMTQETCYQMNNRLLSLQGKYRSNKLVSNKLAEYEYLEIGSGYVHIHKDFPNAKLILEKLVAKGFMTFDLELMKGVDRHGLNWNTPLPEQLTIQVGSLVDVFPAQLAIEALLEHGSKNIGVVLLPQGDGGLGLTMFVGIKPLGSHHVYTGSSIEKLLLPNLTREDFDMLAK